MVLLFITNIVNVEGVVAIPMKGVLVLLSRRVMSLASFVWAMLCTAWLHRDRDLRRGAQLSPWQWSDIGIAGTHSSLVGIAIRDQSSIEVTNYPRTWYRATMAKSEMLTIHTENKSEAWRCRIAMFAGISKTLTINGGQIEGLVRSIRQECNVPPRWAVCIVPAEVRKEIPKRYYRGKRETTLSG